jgi:2,3-bisphosphoglycerate-independent phosphoglycerate mutase
MSEEVVPSVLGKVIRRAYREGQEDEALEPIIKVDSGGRPAGRLDDGDYVIFYDIRGEREIELTQSLTEPRFSRFPAKSNVKLRFVTMIEYDPSLKVKVAFPPDSKLKNTLAEVITRTGLNLVKIAESEKAVHIGYFLNGKNDELFPGEERIVIPSPEAKSYSSTPEMSASQVAEEVCSRLEKDRAEFLIANLANVDVVGHIEDKKAVIAAVESVDRELGRIIRVSRSQKICLIVTADHGTVEEWLYPEGAINTGHTKNPVPFILADFSSEEPKSLRLRDRGELADVAPTILEIFGIAQPSQMTGKSLCVRPPEEPRRTRRVLLLILDGWGMREEKFGNLLAEARTPHFNHLWQEFPHALLEASGEAVGMPPGTVGNSEAGHLHLGAGRRVFLDRVKIDRAIADGQINSNEAFLWAMEGAKRDGKPLHFLGIVSHYSSHGTIKHLFALLQMAKKVGVPEVYIHALIGRRGERPESGALYVEKVEEMCRSLSLGEVVTVIGRYWALDREGNWDRVEKTYRALVWGEGTPARG